MARRKARPQRSKPSKRSSGSRSRRRKPAARRGATRRKAAPKRRRTAAKPKARPARAKTAARRKPQKAVARAPRPAPPATLGRERRRLSDDERLTVAPAPDDRLISAARTGHDELAAELRRHTQTGPKLTAGDVDAKWQDAYSVGDEAPGGDNPTPDQDVVDDIGKALGINYRDDEELQGGEEVAKRDRNRWELDPASSDDWPEGHEK